MVKKELKNKEEQEKANQIQKNDTIEKVQKNTYNKRENEEVILSKKQEFFQFLKFLAFSISAGVIQLISFELLYTWTKCLAWWPAYLISITLSVIWNFTFNRKFTFKAASNVPLAMTIVIIYYAMFIPVSTFGGNALEQIGWNGTLVTFIMMVLNFITEFFWDKFIVFNDKLINKISNKFKGLFKKEQILEHEIEQVEIKEKEKESSEEEKAD